MAAAAETRASFELFFLTRQCASTYFGLLTRSLGVRVVCLQEMVHRLLESLLTALSHHTTTTASSKSAKLILISMISELANYIRI